MQLKLKVLWLKNFLGFTIDQRAAQHLSPLTTYYFWPKTEAWDQLKLELDSKTWIKREDKVTILNTITEIIDDWSQNRNNKPPQKDLPNVEFVEVQD